MSIYTYYIKSVYLIYARLVRKRIFCSARAHHLQDISYHSIVQHPSHSSMLFLDFFQLGSDSWVFAEFSFCGVCRDSDGLGSIALTLKSAFTDRNFETVNSKIFICTCLC